MRRLAALPAALLLLTLPSPAGAAPSSRTVRFTAAFALTQRFETRLVPSSPLVGCTYDEQLMPLEGTTNERDAVSVSGSLDYAVRHFGSGPPLVRGPALNPLRGRDVTAGFAIERRGDVRRPAPCDPDARERDRTAPPIPLPLPCPASATERPPGRVEIDLVSRDRWLLDLPRPRACASGPSGPLFPNTAPSPTFRLPSFERLARRGRTVVPVGGRGDCSASASGDYRLDCTVTVSGTLTLTRRR
jgi:hypothetical protein